MVVGISDDSKINDFTKGSCNKGITSEEISQHKTLHESMSPH